jgi:predicted amino acid dehydrogenase
LRMKWMSRAGVPTTISQGCFSALRKTKTNQQKHVQTRETDCIHNTTQTYNTIYVICPIDPEPPKSETVLKLKGFAHCLKQNT